MKTQEQKNIKTKQQTRLPKSIRKYIRIEKSRIRKEINIEQQAGLINQIYLRFLKKTNNSEPIVDKK